MNNEIGRLDERLCPLCERENHCSVQSGECWCFHTKVPQELLDRIPVELRNKVCICSKCVEEFETQKLRN